MSASAHLASVRLQVESSLAKRAPNAFNPQPKTASERTPSGIPSLDALLQGGLPVGAIAEMIGLTGSGRTTLTLAFLAATLREGKVAAWIDADDTFDPTTAAAIDLTRLLWVRCGAPTCTTTPESIPLTPQTPAEPIPLDHPALHGGGGQHPRSEAHGMPQAISAILQPHGGLRNQQDPAHHTRRNRRVIGTPGAPNRPLTESSPSREEQIPTDRQPPRRGEQLARPPLAAAPRTHKPIFNQPQRPRKPAWSALDQAIRATDLLLQSGGFGLIVLDLGSTPPEMAWRIPLATWFRFRAACERSRTTLLLLSQHPCTRSSAELAVRMHPGHFESEGNVLTAITFHAELERQRFPALSNIVPIRKPPQSQRPGQWKGSTAWAVRA